MCVVTNVLCLPLDLSDVSTAKWKQSKREDDALGSLSSGTEAADLAGNRVHPASGPGDCELTQVLR